MHVWNKVYLAKYSCLTKAHVIAMRHDSHLFLPNFVDTSTYYHYAGVEEFTEISVIKTCAAHAITISARGNNFFFFVIISLPIPFQ